MKTSKPKFHPNTIWLGGAACLVATFAFVLAGCSGGGGGGVNPSPTNTPVPTGVGVTVQLRDTANAPVDGIVTVASQPKATTNGNATFSNVPAGVQTASAEVNGRTYQQSFIATSGSQTVQILIDPTVSATPTPTGPPNPPF